MTKHPIFPFMLRLAKEQGIGTYKLGSVVGTTAVFYWFRPSGYKARTFGLILRALNALGVTVILREQSGKEWELSPDSIRSLP